MTREEITGMTEREKRKKIQILLEEAIQIALHTEFEDYSWRKIIARMLEKVENEIGTQVAMMDQEES